MSSAKTSKALFASREATRNTASFSLKPPDPIRSIALYNARSGS